MLLRPLHHYRRCLVILVVIPLTWSFLLIGGTDNNYNHKVAMSLSASATSANSDDNSSNQRDDANESSAQDCKETSVEESTNEGAVPLLEAPDPNESLPTFKLGETIRLEEMGPIIINTDGTTRRIENWDQMTERERQVTWRRISKRNEERRQKLLQQLEQQQQENEKGEK